MRAEFPNELRFQLVFEAAGLCRFHDLAMRTSRHFGRSAHRRQLSSTFVQTHVVQQMVQGNEFMRSMRSRGSSAAQRIHPFRDALIKIGVNAHCVVNPITRLDDPREYVVDVFDGKRVRRAKFLNRTIRPRTGSIPAFSQLIPLPAKQNVITTFSAWRQYGDSLRLREASQIVEVAVLAETILNISAACADRSAWQNSHAVRADHAHQLLSTFGKFGVVHLDGGLY